MNKFWLWLYLAFFLCATAQDGFCAAFLKKNLDNDVIQTIMSRRSVRQYQDRAVERAKLELIVKCGMAAPSPKNSQPWEIRIVTDPLFILGVTGEFIKAHKGQVSDPNFRNIFRNAPAVIFVAGPINGSGNLSCGMLGENMLLAAQSLGLGTCMLGSPVQFMKSYPGARPYLEKLSFPVNYELLYCIGIGYAAENPVPPSRDYGKARFID